jgi:Asp-tRNA(Asn)/Glu-tRNA(Gln) amidotransferase A subunit family amidase
VPAPTYRVAAISASSMPSYAGRSDRRAVAHREAEEQFRTVNVLMLRNTMIANVLDRCAISIPCPRHGDAPVGLMLVGEHGADRRLFSIAAAVEQIVSPEVDKP